jgi:hypothetical protein
VVKNFWFSFRSPGWKIGAQFFHDVRPDPLLSQNPRMKFAPSDFSPTKLEGNHPSCDLEETMKLQISARDRSAYRDPARNFEVGFSSGRSRPATKFLTVRNLNLECGGMTPLFLIPPAPRLLR